MSDPRTRDISGSYLGGERKEVRVRIRHSAVGDSVGRGSVGLIKSN